MSNPNSRLYIANLGPGMDQDWLQRTFGEYGQVEKVFVMHDRKSKSGRFSAFVTLTERSAAERAVQALHKSQCPDGDGYGLTVRFADPPGAKQNHTNQLYGNTNSSNNSYGQQWGGAYGSNNWGSQQGSGSTAAPSATGAVIEVNGKAWYEANDPATRKTYYYTSTGETTWERPIPDKPSASQPSSSSVTPYSDVARAQPYSDSSRAAPY